jgi:cytochrome c556
MRKILVFLLFLNLAGFLSPLQSGYAQSRTLHRLMIDKLKNSQRLLEGIALADFGKITQSAEELIQLSKTSEWMVHKTPRYELHSNEFRRACEVLVQKAKAKNIDGVALAYVDLTMSCVRCHQYVREIQDARLPAAPAAGVALARREP